MRQLLAVYLCLCAASAAAQSMTSISPNWGPGETSGSITITGSGFSTVPKETRFVDINNIDILSGITCSSSTSCTSSYTRTNLLPPGVVENIAVFALVNGVKSGSFAGFTYYGPPLVTSVTPNLSPTRSGIGGISIAGGPFTDGPSYPGTTSLYLQSNISDRTSGCVSTSLCDGYSAPGLSVGVAEGYSPIAVITPGGFIQADFYYVTIPTIPTITSVTPRTIPRMGGPVTITGTGFSTVSGKTIFSSEPLSGSGASDLFSVVCSSTTTCTGTIPSGDGRSDVRVYTIPGTPGTVSKKSANTAADDFTFNGFTVSPPYGTQLATSEAGTTVQITVALNTQPTHNVTVALNRSGDTDEGTLSTSSLLFTPSNWSVAQTVTITGVNDALADGNKSHTISLVGSSSDPGYDAVYGNDIQITNEDNESAGIFFSQKTGLKTTEGGGTATTLVMLRTQPASNVVMSLVSNDSGEGTVSPSSITFTTANWSTPRLITLTGVSDAIADGTSYYEIIVTVATADATYAGLYVQDLSVMNTEEVAAPAAAEDFNGDGKNDLIWRQPSTGTNVWWSMNGATRLGYGYLLNVPGTAWSVGGTGDLSGDGKADIVWRNSATGANVLWRMNGATRSSYANLLSVVGASWVIAGIADFDGDNRDDILWRNGSTGQNVVWFMDDATRLGYVSLLSVPGTDWVIAGVGDLDGDGDPDLVWRNGTTGQNVLWTMNGTTRTSYTNLLSVVGASWRIMACADYDGNDKADLVWRNVSTGQNVMWFMDGATRTSYGSLLSVPDLSFEIQGAK